MHGSVNQNDVRIKPFTFTNNIDRSAEPATGIKETSAFDPNPPTKRSVV